MEAASFNAPAGLLQPGEVGPIPRADAATLGCYLGTADLAESGGQTGAERSSGECSAVLCVCVCVSVW
jgi:hypothetical protein